MTNYISLLCYWCCVECQIEESKDLILEVLPYKFVEGKDVILL